MAITFLCKQKEIYLDPFLCNFIKPKTWENDFSKKKPKSIMSTAECTVHSGTVNIIVSMQTKIISSYPISNWVVLIVLIISEEGYFP